MRTLFVLKTCACHFFSINCLILTKITKDAKTLIFIMFIQVKGNKKVFKNISWIIPRAEQKRTPNLQSHIEFLCYNQMAIAFLGYCRHGTQANLIMWCINFPPIAQLHSISELDLVPVPRFFLSRSLIYSIHNINLLSLQQINKQS